MDKMITDIAEVEIDYSSNASDIQQWYKINDCCTKL